MSNQGDDLKIAAAELAAAREMLATAHAINERRARDEAIKAAVGRLALASRTIAMVVDRRTGSPELWRETKPLREGAL